MNIFWKTAFAHWFACICNYVQCVYNVCTMCVQCIKIKRQLIFLHTHMITRCRECLALSRLYYYSQPIVTPAVYPRLKFYHELGPLVWPDIYRTYSSWLTRYISNIFQLVGQIYIEHISAVWPDIYRTYSSCLARYISNVFQLSGQIYIEHSPAVWPDIYRTYSR